MFLQAPPFFHQPIAHASSRPGLSRTVQVAAVADVQPGGRMGVHGMVVFGSPSTGLYMSHIPMFHKPHDMQAIFSVSFPGTDDFRDGLYTFQPQKFSLDDVLLGHLTTVRGTLYRGSFEGDGQPMRDVTVKVERVLGYTQLDMDSPPAPDLEYQVVGGGTRGRDAYLFHPISKPPDFDQIVRLDLSRSNLTAQDLASGVRLIIDGRADRVQDRLVQGTVQATVAGTDRQVTIAVDRVLSTLVGPDFTDGPAK